jgi:AcrR family transcriptional regulator
LTEAALYRHFKSKEDLLTCALAERSPAFIGILKELPLHVGEGSVRDNLCRVAEAAVPYYQHSIPMLASIFADPNLLARHRTWANETGLGPQRANAALAVYLSAEVQEGRLPASVDPEVISALLLGACLQRGFYAEFLGHTPDARSVPEFATSLVDALLPGPP